MEFSKDAYKFNAELECALTRFLNDSSNNMEKYKESILIMLMEIDRISDMLTQEYKVNGNLLQNTYKKILENVFYKDGFE